MVQHGLHLWSSQLRLDRTSARLSIHGLHARCKLEKRNASEQFIADALWWMETFDLDGARIDAVKHVENLAVSNLVAQINERFETVGTDVYLKGETAMGWSGHSLEANQAQYDAINAYMGPEGLDGQADFVLYHAVVDNVFVSGNENYQHLDYWTNRSQDQYTAGSLMVPYVGSHDVSRLTSRADTGTGDAYNQWAEDGLPGQPGDVPPTMLRSKPTVGC